jgi:hypothetical protein
LLLHLAAPDNAVVAGLVSERESARIALGNEARFVAENGAASPVLAILMATGSPGGEGVEMSYLSSLHGGAVAMAQMPGQGKAVPISGVLPLRFSAEGAAPKWATRGTLTVSAEPVSFLSQSFGRIVSVFMRESGF